VPKQPSRPLPRHSFAKAGPVRKKNDLDLIPPEELRARRIRRILFLAIPATFVLGVAIYFAGPPLSGAIKGLQSRHAARQAFALIDREKWTEADAKARDALILRPTEPEAWRAAARVLSRTEQSAAALDWWKKVDEVHRLTAEDRSDFIGAALKTGELPIAVKQVEVLLAQRGGPTAHDILLAGQVASRQSDPALALDYAERVLADKRAKPYEILSAATLILSVTSPYSEPYASAWKQIEDVARDPKKTASLDALAVLANEQALPPMMAPSGNRSLSLDSTPAPATQGTMALDASVALGENGSPRPNQGTAVSSPPSETSAGSTPQPTPVRQSGDTVSLNLAAPPAPVAAGRTMSLADVANALENHPDARSYHKLLALEVRARQDPILIDQYVADAVQRFGVGDDETLLALASWLNKIGRPAKTLDVLPLERAGQRQDLFLHYLNALAALQHWNDIRNLLTSERFPIEPVLQHMYLAVAQKHLASETGATNEWQRALEVAKTPEKLLTLAKYAEQNFVNDIADTAYSAAIKIAPENREAYAGRLRLALSAGKTADAQTIAAEITQVWPDDAAARNQNTYLQLLLGASHGVAEAAERDAEVLVRTGPRNWPARATLGLARLRLGRTKDALAAIRDLRVTGVEPPGALAVRAAILAANGYEEGARNDALLVSANPLLPEERALIAPLLQ
jgi:hypothetical protein